ncbi:hypothetical protein DPMN_129574 [Dreissena polymorpha]|uniref:Uncharacterized protein n=1 Tax=Dreissena polymorpha TaxID=45954 RepID=A0A9D4H1E8_DREPO|nr:hypothetical protein DPMN_129574 [Dreissena polymorpha]
MHDVLIEFRLGVLSYPLYTNQLYIGQTFHWVVENALGFAAYLVYNLRKEVQVNTPLSANKFAFKEYVTSFLQGKFYTE